MRISTFFDNITLTEMNWMERSKLGTILQPHRGKNRFVHMTNVNKIGVHPRKFHTDPHGIYFYPVDWLFSNNENLDTGRQYGLQKDRWFVADIDLTNAITFSTFTHDDLNALAERNGWADGLREILADEKLLKRVVYRHEDRASNIAWSVVGYLVDKGVTTWRKAFAGVSAIFDDQSVINNHEPVQVLVFDRSVIKLIDSGEQKAVAPSSSANLAEWREGLLTIMKGLRGEYGGTLTWERHGKDDYPKIALEHDGASFAITPRISMSDGVTIEVSYSWNRASGRERIRNEDLKTKSSADVVAQISAIIDKIGTFARRGKEIFFEPAMSEKAARDFLSSLTTAPLKFETSFRYDPNPGYSDMTIKGRHAVSLGKSALGFSFELMIRTDGANLYFSSEVDGNALAATNVGFDPAAPSKNIGEYHRRIIDRIDSVFEWVNPSTGGLSRKFYYEEDYEAAIGFVAKHSGIEALATHYATQIKALEAFRHLPDLQDEIARIFKSRGY